MFERIVAGCLAHRLAVLVLTLVVSVWGAWALRGLTIEAFPDPTDTQVQIITLNSGQPAEEMERQVSIPIERTVNGMPGLTRVRSFNLFGLSYVTLTFRDGVDAYFARAQTAERLRLVELPEGVAAATDSSSMPTAASAARIAFSLATELVSAGQKSVPTLFHCGKWVFSKVDSSPKGPSMYTPVMPGRWFALSVPAPATNGSATMPNTAGLALTLRSTV